MNNACRGALWSAFVSPGIGQIVLKSYRRGIIQLSAFMVMLFPYLREMIPRVMESVRHAIDKAMTEGGTIDGNAILQSTCSGSQLSNVLGWLILACWIAGIIDAYLIGRRKDIIISQGGTQDPLYPQI